MERISSLFSPTIVAASIQKAFEYPIVGEATYTTPGSYTWTCPDKVYSVSVVCVGGGGGGYGGATNSATGGGGGALAYKNTISVVPGVTYNLQVGAGGYTSTAGTRMLATNSWFGNTSTVFAERGQFGRTATGATTVQGISQSGFGGQIYIGDGGGPGGNCGTITTASTFSGGLGAGGAGGYGYTSAEMNEWYSTSFDGSGDGLITSTSTTLALENSNFTVELWYYATGRVQLYPYLIGNGNFGSNRWQINDRHDSNPTKITVFVYNSSSTTALLTSSTSISENTWYHVALVRSGSTFTLYVNGVPEATATFAGLVTSAGQSDYITIGRDFSQNISSFTGYISNVRLVKGTALYTANFIPSREPLWALANTQLLTCQNSVIRDNSNNNFTITTNGNATPIATKPFNVLTVSSGGTGGTANATSGFNGNYGTGGGGGGGSGASTVGGGAGGGVGLYGRGTSGVAGLTGLNMNDPLRAGQPGSNGLPLVANTVGTTIYNIGGEYGGGGGGGQTYFGRGANGAVRIVWPSEFRTFPSQNLQTHSVTQNYQYANLQMGYAVSLQPVTISNNIGPVTYTISPSIPANTNITFNTSTGVISGNATNGYTETVHTISTIDSVGQSSSNTLIISIGAPSNQIVFAGDPGGTSYNTLQTTWTVPANVYSISMITVGCGGSTLIEANGYSSLSGAGAGGTAFVNNYKVAPGQVLDIYIDKPKIGYNVVSQGTSISYSGTTICKANSGANPTSYYTGRGLGGTFVAGQYGYTGGSGGNSTTGFYKGGGGGTAGYYGDGGAGGPALTSGLSAATGSGGGGGGAPTNNATAAGLGGGGGGIGLQGKGANGSGASYIAGQTVGTHGRNGSYRGDIVQLESTNLGGDYGGGAGGALYNSLNSGAYGGPGAIRIMWPGTLRRYDANTRTEDTKPLGQVEFTTFGTYTWTCPEGVYSVSAVCIGAGGTASSSQFSVVPPRGGGGAGLGYKNNIPVVPGQSYTIQVGRRGEWVANNYALLSTNSWFMSASTVAGIAGGLSNLGISGGTYIGDGGGNGGTGGAGGTGSGGAGGGGAGGYSGNGGNGGQSGSSAGTNGSGGGGGGGAGYFGGNPLRNIGGNGGGTGLQGQGANGVGGSGFTTSGTSPNIFYYANNATAGSGGSGKTYGGGGNSYSGYGGDGAVRLIWPGDARQFPSTRTADEF